MNAYQTVYLEQINGEIEKTPDEYLPMLVEIIRLFRQGWKEALEEKTMPIDDLWVGIDE